MQVYQARCEACDKLRTCRMLDQKKIVHAQLCSSLGEVGQPSRGATFRPPEEVVHHCI